MESWMVLLCRRVLYFKIKATEYDFRLKVKYFLNVTIYFIDTFYYKSGEWCIVIIMTLYEFNLFDTGIIHQFEKGTC